VSALIPDLQYRCPPSYPSDNPIRPDGYRPIASACLAECSKKSIPGAECDYLLFNNKSEC